MQEEHTPNESRLITIDRRWLVVGAAVILVALVIVTYATRSRVGESTHPPPSVAQSSGPEDVEQRIIADAERSRQHEIAQRQLAARMKHKTVERQLDDGLVLVGQLDNEIERWTRDILPLLDSEDGKRLATKREYIQAYAAILSKERMGKDVADALRTWFVDARERVTAAIDAGSVATPTESLTAEIAEVMQRVRSARDGYRDARRTVEGLLANAKQANGGFASGNTLRVAMELYDRAYAEERAVRLAEQHDRFERDLTARLVAIEKDHHERAANLETQSAQQRLDDERRKAEVEAKLAKQRAEQDRLETLANSPEVQRRFAAFLEDGTVGVFRELRPPAPLSYGRLKNFGVFEDFDKFAKMRSSRESDRTTLPYPQTKQELAEWREDWELFKQLAPIWRDAGKLAP